MMMTISPDNKSFIKSHLKLTSDETFSLEEETAQQSLSSRWFKERKKRITASNFGAIINRRLCNQTPSFKKLWAIQRFINLKLVSGD